jgi:LSU ribosomal protein L41E
MKRSSRNWKKVHQDRWKTRKKKLQERKRKRKLMRKAI